MNREDKIKYLKGRKYYNVTNKNVVLKLLETYKDRTDLDIQHPPRKLKWWQKLIGAFKGRKPKQR